MKSVLVQISVLVFCIFCSNWQIAEISPGNCESVIIAGNNDSFHNGSLKPNVPIDDTPDSPMFACSQLQIFNPGRNALYIIHLLNFVAIPRQHYFPDRAMPPPAC
jgi:hypothetical protein